MIKSSIRNKEKLHLIDFEIVNYRNCLYLNGTTGAFFVLCFFNNNNKFSLFVYTYLSSFVENSVFLFSFRER